MIRDILWALKALNKKVTKRYKMVIGPKYTGEELREALAKRAEMEWKKPVKEVKGEINETITGYFDENNWGAWLRDPARGDCPNGYIRPPDPDWCGQFAAYCSLNVGEVLNDPDVKINPKIARMVLVSTYRLYYKWEDLKLERPEVSKEDIKRGDIVVFKWNDRKDYGHHIAIAIEDMDKTKKFKTIEGNASGLRGDGTSGRGVVQRLRSRGLVAKVYRLEPKHFIGI